MEEELGLCDLFKP